jgi:hypothetical protein
MKTFNRLLTQIGPRIKAKDVDSIRRSINKLFANHLKYISKLSPEEYATFILSIFFRNQGHSDQIEKLLQDKKIWTYTVLEPSDREGTKTCEECTGSGELSCNECGGSGEVDCETCDGTGENNCWKCDGEGVDEEGDECTTCDGNGTIDCSDCNGSGDVDCDECYNGEVECGYCEGEGTMVVEGFSRYPFRTYITTDSSEIKSVEDAIKNNRYEDFKPQNSILIDDGYLTIEDIEVPNDYLLFNAEPMTLESLGRYYFSSLIGFNSFINMMRNEIFNEWYE